MAWLRRLLWRRDLSGADRAAMAFDLNTASVEKLAGQFQGLNNTFRRTT